MKDFFTWLMTDWEQKPYLPLFILGILSVYFSLLIWAFLVSAYLGMLVVLLTFFGIPLGAYIIDRRKPHD